MFLLDVPCVSTPACARQGLPRIASPPRLRAFGDWKPPRCAHLSKRRKCRDSPPAPTTLSLVAARVTLVPSYHRKTTELRPRASGDQQVPIVALSGIDLDPLGSTKAIVKAMGFDGDRRSPALELTGAALGVLPSPSYERRGPTARRRPRDGYSRNSKLNVNARRPLFRTRKEPHSHNQPLAG